MSEIKKILLDIGCGGKINAPVSSLDNNNYYDVIVGLDIQPNRGIQADARILPLPPSSVTAAQIVLPLGNLLEELTVPNSPLLLGIGRTLEPGGRLDIVLDQPSESVHPSLPNFRIESPLKVSQALRNTNQGNYPVFSKISLFHPNGEWLDSLLPNSPTLQNMAKLGPLPEILRIKAKRRSNQ